MAPRERLHLAHIRALDQLARSLEEQRDFTGAVRHVHRLLRYEPLRESAYRRLMRIHATNGDRAKALEAYHLCAETLEQELGVEPCQATREMYDRLLASKAKVSHPTRDLVATATGTPLVGRKRAWAELQIAWQTALRRGPHVALVTGEAGIGKTRLAEELLTWAERQGFSTAVTRASTAETNLAYAPLIRLLRTDTLQRAMSELDDVWLTELARLVPELSTDRPTLAPPEPLTEGWRRQRIFEAVGRALLAVRQPLVLFMDDLQWGDEETLAWLHYLLTSAGRAQLLIVGALRSEEVQADHPVSPLLTELRGRRALTEIELGPLDATDAAALSRHAAGRELGAQDKAWLYRETEGNPLFIVETIGATIPTARPGSSALDGFPSARQASLDPGPLSPPPKVRAVIDRRLGQLSLEARELAAVAAVVGRQFPFEVVAGASGRPEDAAVAAFDELWQRGIIRQGEGDLYDFSHQKIREAAYAGLSPARRQFLHRRVAQVRGVRIDGNIDEAVSNPAPVPRKLTFA